VKDIQTAKFMLTTQTAIQTMSTIIHLTTLNDDAIPISIVLTSAPSGSIPNHYEQTWLSVTSNDQGNRCY